MPVLAFILATVAAILFAVETLRTKSLTTAAFTCLTVAWIVASVHHAGTLITW
jgi:hypothetical protein